MHVFRLRVTAEDTAFASGVHVYYATYLRYMDLAVQDQLASLGFDRMTLFTRLHGFDGIRRVEIEYLAPAIDGDELAVTTWVEAARGVRLLRRYEIRREPAGELLAQARTEAIWITDAHRPGRWPRELLGALGVEQAATISPGDQSA